MNKHPTKEFLTALYLYGGVNEVEKYLKANKINFELNEVNFENPEERSTFCAMHNKNIFNLPLQNELKAVEIILI